jgi:hypothetical protein
MRKSRKKRLRHDPVDTRISRRSRDKARLLMAMIPVGSGGILRMLPTNTAPQSHSSVPGQILHLAKIYLCVGGVGGADLRIDGTYRVRSGGVVGVLVAWCCSRAILGEAGCVGRRGGRRFFSGSWGWAGCWQMGVEDSSPAGGWVRFGR